MIDIIYVARVDSVDERFFKRLSFSARSLFNGSHKAINFAICDTSEHSVEKKLRAVMPCDFSYYHHATLPPYNKSFNINLAVRQFCTNEHFLFTDIDMVFKENHIEHCLKLVGQYPIITYLTHALHSEFYSSNFDELKGQPGKRITIGGGFFAQRRAYMAINGFDEDYRGWGAEDSDFYNRAQQQYSILRPCREIEVAHLWHPNHDASKAVYQRKNMIRYKQRTPLIKSGEVAPSNIKSILRDIDFQL
jgi:hypothetical protein